MSRCTTHCIKVGHKGCILELLLFLWLSFIDRWNCLFVLSNFSAILWLSLLPYVPHLLRHGTSVFKVISKRLVILTSECHAMLLAKEQSLPILNILGLTQLAWAGLELMTSRCEARALPLGYRNRLLIDKKLLGLCGCISSHVFGS
jgi:hypothetical protein